MNSRERVLASLARRDPDRIPVKHEGTPEIDAMLCEHFGLSNIEQLLLVLGDDFRYVAADYVGPELRTFPDGSVEGYWGERYGYARFEGGRYLESLYQPYAGVETVEELDRSHFPSADWFDYSRIRERAAARGGAEQGAQDQQDGKDEKAAESAEPGKTSNDRKSEESAGFAVCFGTAGDMDFINSIGRARGVEQVFFDLATESPVFLEIMEARFRFYYEMHERALEAAGGLIDICHVGEDLGTQRGPTIGMKTFEKHFAPKYEAYFDMVHRHGALVMMHMCGCVERFLPRLVELGLDIQDVVQPTTPEMDIALLKERYGARLQFCGSVCVQTTLPHGSVADVEREVRRRLELFPRGGLFLGPTHAIQVGTPIENILALYRSAGSLREVDDAIRAAGTEADLVGKIDLSKLF